MKRHFVQHSIFVFGLFAILTSTVAKPSFSLSPPSLPSFASFTQEYVGRKHAAQMKNYRYVDWHTNASFFFLHFQFFVFFFGVECRSLNVTLLLLWLWLPLTVYHFNEHSFDFVTMIFFPFFLFFFYFAVVSGNETIHCWWFIIMIKP